MTNQVPTQRISPSGPLLGSPPALVGGGQVDGRCWRAQGAGGSTQIPNVAPGADPFTWTPVLGLESVPVDFQSGYGYDIAVDFVANGGAVNQQLYSLQVQVSLDGIAWTTVMAGRDVNCYDILADARLHQVATPAPYANYKFARVVVQSSAPATPNLTYLPYFCTLVIQEYTTA